MVRQRRSVAEMRCTVCGERTYESDRWMFDLGSWVCQDGRWLWMTTEAPVHLACAETAFKVCPHLRSRGQEPRRFPMAFRVVAQMVGGAAVERDFGLRIPESTPVIGHLKIALTVAQVAEFTRPPVTR